MASAGGLSVCGRWFATALGFRGVRARLAFADGSDQPGVGDTIRIACVTLAPHGYAGEWLRGHPGRLGEAEPRPRGSASEPLAEWCCYPAETMGALSGPALAWYPTAQGDAAAPSAVARDRTWCPAFEVDEAIEFTEGCQVTTLIGNPVSRSPIHGQTGPR